MQPRLEMIIDGRDTSIENAFCASFLQLTFEDIIATIGLSRVSLQSILILFGVVFPMDC
jgi:hypothetical protein